MLIGAVLICIISLAFCYVVQKDGYLIYLDSDMSSELILAREQADTGHLFERQWLYSTEVHLIHMNLLYALGFSLTSSYQYARIFGVLTGFVLAMGSMFLLLRRLGQKRWVSALTGAILPLTLSTIYASSVTIAGHYLLSMSFAFLGAALWLDSIRKSAGWPIVLGYLGICFLNGFLTVRHVLCFMVPMMVVAALRWIRSGRRPDRVFWVSLAGFGSCILGYGTGEVILPRLFFSGAGSATSFGFNPLDGKMLTELAATIVQDGFKLMGWKGDAGVFSLPGAGNLMLAGTAVLGWMMVRERKRSDCEQVEIYLEYATAAVFVNLFCFLCIRGAYVNRYQVYAFLFLIPALPLLIGAVSNRVLKTCFVSFAVLWLLLGSSGFYLGVRNQMEGAREMWAPREETLSWLADHGYRKGYGTFWNVRVMEERSEGKMRFCGVVPAAAEEGAVCPVTLEFIRWLETDERSDLDWSQEKTCLLLNREEEEEMKPWLDWVKAPCIYANRDYGVYGFDSSTDFVNAVLRGKAKLEKADQSDGKIVLSPGGRFRIPTSRREAGRYEITLDIQGDPGDDARVEVYTGREFDLKASAALREGSVVCPVDLPDADKYFMILVRNGDREIVLTRLDLKKVGDGPEM